MLKIYSQYTDSNVIIYGLPSGEPLFGAVCRYK